MTRTLAICAILALTAASSGCSIAVRAELLNPLNRSGRSERSESVPIPQGPAPTPVPTATPGGAK